MKLLIGVLCLVLVMSVSEFVRAESCSKLVLAASSKMNDHFDALKVYKKVEDRTEMYRKGRRKASSDAAGVQELKRTILFSERLVRESGFSIEIVMPDAEQRFFMKMAELLVKDIEDKSSEVVLLCVGRMRMSDGVRHFMLSVTKDEEGDSYWNAQLY